MPATTPTTRDWPRTASTNPRSASSANPASLSDAAQDAVASFQKYARERPDVVALWCLGIGFVLGWKLKPW